MANQNSQATQTGDSSGRPSSAWRWCFPVVAGLFVMVCGAVVFLYRPRSQSARNAVVSIQPDQAVGPSANPHGYLGPQACAACHAERVEEFHATRHYLACVVPSADHMPEGFSPGKGSFRPRDAAVRFEMTQASGEFLQTAIRSTPSGEERATSTIDLVYGSGAQTDEVYFTWHGDQISELPMSWLHPQGEWGTAGFDRDGSDDFSRKTTPRCLECHNTWMDHTPGTLNQYKRETAILGVTCEVCHGPGKDHVNFHRTHPAARSGQAVVHPGRLPRERLMDLCAHCHSNALKHRGPAFNYRPGQPLDAYYKTLTTKYPEDDHVANQTTYLRESKCYQKSETLTCVTCHNPHVAIKLSERGAGHSACLECHQAVDCGERDKLPVAVQDNCVGCHMPRGKKIQVAFETASVPYLAPVGKWEHRIAVHPVARDEVLLDWHQSQSGDVSSDKVARLKKSLTEHWLNEAESCRRAFRYLAAREAYRRALILDAAPATEEKLREVEAIQTTLERDMTRAIHRMKEGRYDEAFELVKHVLTLKPNLAAAHGRLGTLYALRGDDELATQHWRAVVQHDPDDQYGESMLGWRDYTQGRAAEALAAFERAEAIEPYFAKINYHMALALVKLERWPEAIARLQRLLVIDPNHVEGCVSLCQALRINHRPEESLTYARRAVELTREENLGVLAVLAETYAELGQFREAEDTASKMLKVAAVRNPAIIPEIRRQLTDWRSRYRKAAP
jgi:tetratricopeptide (TPR) repeat protein